MTNDDKISRGKLAMQLEEIESDHKERCMAKKLAAAKQRKNENLRCVAEKAASDADCKALKVEELRRADEAAAREKRLSIERKLRLAEQRKQNVLSTTAGKASASSSSKKEAARKAWVSSLAAEKKLEVRSAQKMASAANRKQKVCCDDSSCLRCRDVILIASRL